MPITVYIALATLIAGFAGGWQVQQWRWDASVKEALETRYTAYVTRDRIKERIVKKYIDRVEVVEVKTKELIHVAASVPSGTCPSLPNGFVELHDAAAASRESSPARVADAAPSGVTPAETAATVAANYGTYSVVAERLIGLQAYVREACK
jgi:hypothetical protein